MRVLNRVAPSTSPIRKAPIRLRDAEHVADAAERDREPEEQDRETIHHRETPGAATRTCRPSGPGEHRDEECERDAELQRDDPHVGLAVDHHGDDREVERDEDILHDRDAEDDRSLRVREPPQLDQELGHDRAG